MRPPGRSFCARLRSHQAQEAGATEDRRVKTSRFRDEQIARALRQAEAGTPVGEICRKLGVSEQSFYRWKKRFGALGVSELREVRQLPAETRQLNGLAA